MPALIIFLWYLVSVAGFSVVLSVCAHGNICIACVSSLLFPDRCSYEYFPLKIANGLVRSMLFLIFYETRIFPEIAQKSGIGKWICTNREMEIWTPTMSKSPRSDFPYVGTPT